MSTPASFLTRPPRRQWLLDFMRQWPWVYPRGVAENARGWIARAQRRAGWYAGLRGAWCEELHPGGLAHHLLPENLSAAARLEFDAVASRYYPPAAVFYFQGASLVGDEGRVVTPDNRVQAEFFHQFGIRSAPAAARGKAFELATTDLVRTSEPVALLAAPQGWNYYHWLFDVLPRAHLLKQWQHAIVRYAVSDRLGAVQLESLGLLGIDESRLLRLRPRQRVRCQHLYVPALPGSEGCYPPWGLQFLRDSFLPRAADVAGQGPRLYLKRGAGAARPTLNEEELIAGLARFGFKAIAPETLTFREQVAAFRDARVIFAAHGAGLANLAFASPGARVLELFSADYLRPDCYFTLSRRLGLVYDFWMDPSAATRGEPWGSIRPPLDVLLRKIDSLDAR